MLKWIVERIEGEADARDTAIGRLPAEGALDLSGLDISRERVDLLLGVDGNVWREEAGLAREHLATFGAQLPPALWREQEQLEQRLEATS